MKFERVGFKIIGLFDTNPELKGKLVRDIPIKMLDELPEFIENNNVEIAALTLPKQNAKATALKLVSLGVHEIWNFAHVDLDDIPDVVIENVHLSVNVSATSSKILFSRTMDLQNILISWKL